MWHRWGVGKLAALAMPYRDHAHKRDWELRHRVQWLAGRCELRRIEMAHKRARPPTARIKMNERNGFLWLLITGGFLALSILQARLPLLTLQSIGSVTEDLLD